MEHTNIWDNHMRILSTFTDDIESFQDCSEFIKESSIPINLSGKTVDLSNISEDKVSKQILKTNITAMTPLRSTGNGNCLFNSVSLLISGDESFATELRV